MHALHHLGDASFDASLVAQFGNVLAAFADDDTGLFGGHDGAQSQLSLGVFFIGAGCGLAIRAQATLIVELNAIEGAGKVVAIGRDILRSRHGVRFGMRTEVMKGESLRADRRRFDWRSNNSRAMDMAQSAQSW